MRLPSHTVLAAALTLTSILSVAGPQAPGGEWRQFRGPGGLGTSDETGLPVRWSTSENVVWRTELPGPGTSSPIVVGDKVFLTCYTGYALDANAPGDMAALKRHVACLDRADGRIAWQRTFEPELPEHRYEGEGTYHGYSSSTIATDGERLFVFFGRSGVYALDLDGNTLWRTDVGDGTHGWGSGASPVLHKDLVLINASVESNSLVALNRATGAEAWRTGGINASWNTPVLVPVTGGNPELVVSVESRLLAFDPDTGEALWNADGVHRYVCPSVVAGDGVVFAIGGGHTSLAVRAGGRGDVTATHTLWRENRGSNVSSPIYHEGHLYWASDSGGVVTCQEGATGKTVYQERLNPESGLIYASPILAEGKLYYVSQRHGTYVVAARPEYELLAHNVFDDDDSRANASPAASEGQLLLRNDRHLYCIGRPR
jgi:outer membrane protein assembly factor BamB